MLFSLIDKSVFEVDGEEDKYDFASQGNDDVFEVIGFNEGQKTGGSDVVKDRGHNEAIDRNEQKAE